ncbi:MAG: hypothetical protein HOP02_15280 [Methylococcaceae bacterium]|nr:hypothetical protein [Methylococcaceae bacterium]
MTIETEQKRNKPFTLKILLEEQLDFKGDIAAFLFDSAGNLLEMSKVKEGKVSFSHSEQEVVRNRLFIAPVANQSDENTEKPSIKMMERLSAYEPVLNHRGRLIDTIRVPSSIIDLWPICFCWVRGHVIKDDSVLPVCGAKVHICEVDRFWRWILKLPDLEVFRFRDDLIKIFDDPMLRRPPRPEPPDPSPFSAIKGGLIHLNYLNPQPEPHFPINTLNTLSIRRGGEVTLNPQPLPPKETVLALPIEVRSALSSASALAVRETLVANVRLIAPYLCLLWPWWKYRCDEITVVETDALGRFQTTVFYSCKGDKPDLYFWVEYELGGVLETVYHPSLACHTYWNYACGTDVIIRIKDDRVPACNNGPDLPGCVVQILAIGREVSMLEVQGNGAALAVEGLTTSNQPFGGKLEPRIWLSRTTLRDVKHIKYYRWSYQRLTQGDGTLLATPQPWIQLTRTVVRHYALPVPSGVAHVPLTLGPQLVGSETNLFEIRPAAVPAGGIEWSVVDEREDLASAHFETDKLGIGENVCQKAFDSAGKYEIKLELFKNTGALIDWTAEGIDLQITDVPAPFGINTVTAATASDYYRIKNDVGHTVAFKMVLRIDNNCCQAEINPVGGIGLVNTPCGFIEYATGASTMLSFKAYHPNSFADFDFSVVRGVSNPVSEASAAGRVGSSASVTTNNPAPPLRAYALTLPGSYRESFGVGELLGSCTRAAFSEALHVWTRATDGYGRLWYLDAFSHDGFALTPSP